MMENFELNGKTYKAVSDTTRKAHKSSCELCDLQPAKTGQSCKDTPNCIGSQCYFKEVPKPKPNWLRAITWWCIIIVTTAILAALIF